MRRNRIEVPCAYCGATLERPPYKIKRSPHHYCNRECANKGFGLFHSGPASKQFTSTDVTCVQCGKPLTRIPARAKKQTNHFCDSTCKGEWQIVNQRGQNNPAYTNGGHPVACAQCGKTFTVNAWKLRHRKNHFCGQSCYWAWKPVNHSGPNSPSWKGGPVDYYGHNWPSQRRAARERDGYKCQHCRITEKEIGVELNVHHLTPFRRYGIANYRVANQLTNLICLCASCHIRAEYGNIPLQPKLL